MYKIHYYHPDTAAETLVYAGGEFAEVTDCRSAVLVTEVNTAGSLTLNIGPDNPSASVIELMRGEFRVRDGSTLLFRGRPVRMEKEFDGSMTIEAEGLLAMLDDIEQVITFSQSGSGAIAAYIGTVITAYNSWQSDTTKRITVGTVSVTDPNYTMEVNEEYGINLWEALSKYTAKSDLSGYLIADYSSTSTIGLSYLAALPSSGQNITFGLNLLDLVTERDGSDIVTRCIPTGKDGLTIQSVTDGTYAGYTKNDIYLWDDTAQAKYGKILRYVDFDELETAQEVLYAGIDYMKQHSGVFAESIKISALDLSLINEDITRFRAGKTVTVRSTLGGTAASYALTKMEMDVTDPAESTITLEIAAVRTKSAKKTGSISQDVTKAAESKGQKGEKGDTGAAGRGIRSIAKTSTSVLTDTYTITYTDSTTSTFQVVNGNGEPVSVSTEAAMDTVMVAANVGMAFLYTGATTSKYTQGDIYVVEETS